MQHMPPIFKYLRDYSVQKGLGFFFVTTGANWDQIEGIRAKNISTYSHKYFHLLSQIGASLSQATLFPKRRQAADGEPMSRYLRRTKE